MAWTDGRSSSRIGSMRSLSEGRATTTPPRPPSGRRAGASRIRVPAGRGRPRRLPQGGRAEPEQRGSEPCPGDLAALERVGRGAVRRGRWRRGVSPARISGSAPAGQEGGRCAVADDEADPMDRRAATARAAGVAIAGQQRGAGRDPDDRPAEPVGQPLRRGDPDAQPGEGARPVPTAMAASLSMPTEPPSRRVDGEERLAVAVTGGPFGRLEHRPVERRRWRGRSASSRCRSRGSLGAARGRSSHRLQVAAEVGRPGADGDGSRVVAGPVDDDVEPLGGRAGPSRSGHSTSVTPADWRSSMRPPPRASVASARRYRSMWKSGRRPAYSAMRMNDGDVIVSVTPRPAPNAFARWVLPAPRSPQRQIRSPGSAAVARAPPRAAVASGSGARR